MSLHSFTFFSHFIIKTIHVYNNIQALRKNKVFNSISPSLQSPTPYTVRRTHRRKSLWGWVAGSVVHGNEFSLRRA